MARLGVGNDIKLQAGLFELYTYVGFLDPLVVERQILSFILHVRLHHPVAGYQAKCLDRNKGRPPKALCTTVHG